MLKSKNFKLENEILNIKNKLKEIEHKNLENNDFPCGNSISNISFDKNIQGYEINKLNKEIQNYVLEINILKEENVNLKIN